MPLWVKPYKIIATSGSSGVIECIQNSTSIDAMKEKRIKQKLNPSLKAWIEDLPNVDEKKKVRIQQVSILTRSRTSPTPTHPTPPLLRIS